MAGQRKRILGWALLAGLVIPIVVGVLLNTDLEPRLRTLPGGAVLVEFGALMVGVAAWRLRHPKPVAGAFLDRYPRVAVIIALAFGGLCVAFGAPMSLDWAAQPDEAIVIVTATHATGRGMSVDIHFADGSYETAIFYWPNVQAGPTRLLLGHFSQRVIGVEQ